MSVGKEPPATADRSCGEQRLGRQAEAWLRVGCQKVVAVNRRRAGVAPPGDKEGVARRYRYGKVK